MFDLDNLVRDISSANDLITMIVVIALVLFGIVCLVFLLEYIGKAFLLKKSGEKAWKAFIPIYGDITFCKVSGTNYSWLVLILAFFVLTMIDDEFSFLYSIVYFCYRIVLAASFAKCFCKGTGYTIGLVMLPGIFYLVLGLSKSSYLGPVGCKDPFFDGFPYGRTKNDTKDNTFKPYNMDVNSNPANEVKYQFCHTCGHALTEFDRFCPGCGREL